MKQCPNCQKEYDDSKRFCQSDGTALVEIVENIPASVDDFKTVVGNQSIINDDPYKTVVASDLLSKDEDLLQIPESSDPLKTIVSSSNEPSIPIPTDVPTFNEPSLAPPNLSELSVKSPKVEEPKPPVIETEIPVMMPPPISELPDFSSTPLPSESPFGKADSAPIPSPFEQTTPKFDLPTFKEEEKSFQSPIANPFEKPFGNQQIEQPSAWNPPPAPEASWQQQNIGQNTPFQPPVVSNVGQGQTQTLAIVSLVCGILGLCCGISGIVALITGYIARSNPNQHGGQGMALAGMILGGISILLMIVGIILQVLGAFIR